jgi:outer membrane protein OmpA-like peptidoglycan-associated protein/tetratricopeptide (TPR) repeat protein
MKKIIFLIIMALITTIGYSQANTPFDKNHITDKKQLSEANKKIKEGDKLFTIGKGRYIDALTYYLEANKINPNNADLNYKIGICYLFTTDKQLGLEHLEKAKQLNPQVNYELSYYLGRAYHLNNQFDKAIEYYNEFKSRLSPKEFAVRGKELDKLIEECENGKEFIENPLNVKISNIGSTINTIYPDYAPVISADEKILFFTSRRPSTTGGKRDPSDNKYYEDIFMVTKKDTIWQLPIISDLNDKKHNGAIGMYNWGEKTYLYTYKSKHNGDIYESIINDNKITIPEPLPNPINTRFHESSASLSRDGNYLYFISDRPGGMGGKDIWMSQREYNDTWTNPINLSAINTLYDEEGVFIHQDGKTLYFSSNGHNTMGGYDIFRTVYDGKTWSKPINLGYPINTAADDLYFVFASSGQRAYFSSSRQGTIGDQDIFIINFLKEKPLLISDENEYVARQNQPIKSLDTIKQSIIKESENLKNEIAQNMDDSDTNPCRTINWSDKIFFDFDDFKLDSIDIDKLDSLYNFLNKNHNAITLISTHTDNIGSDEYNKLLSEKRAQSIINYLIKRGIDRSRIYYMGYGYEIPSDDNNTKEGRQLNRRAEFKIIYVL